ncbi:uncharacterized protein DUF4990 [Lutibacter oceani]|uniref:Uncharacterized protein DUF4990 n=1 Tax=Lutibacter oceani TaxID=1853311 RepID=A0A3D9RWG7_9FLAO|nr:right-handed parallel beta-helix repeat-containing protein [Lutibacter oceani]REE82121.1 uncharacterized protein DUF4990 [Lutibacter oceani]
MKTTKYIYFIKALLVFIVSVQIIACSSDDDVIEPQIVTEPGKSVLVLPINNTECEVGEIIANKATVIFEWNASEATESYDLEITNLVTREVTRRPNLVSTSKEVKLERGFPYSWIVTSKNSGELVTVSDISKFYLAGEAGSNNVPFPASLLSPLSGITIAPVDGKVMLEWESSNIDTDGEALTFDVFIDTVDGNQATPEEWKGITDTNFEISVEPNTIYYWHIETSDGINSSISATYTFKTGDNIASVQGTIVSTSQEILTAIANAVPGEKIYIHGGDYVFDSTIEIGNNGSDANVISLLAHPGDATRPKFDFSSMSENSSNRGIQLNGNYWYIQGIDVYGAGDNGMFIQGSNNLIEFCTFSENSDTGLQIGNGASKNTILNCDSFYNADSSLENADGFACKLDAGTDNKFIGCRAWKNLDDGWDGYLRGNDNITTTYENCWAIENGFLKDGSVSGGDGNGFKTGGSDNKDLKHNAIFTNCIAVGNGFDGFDHNSNRGNVTIYNCAAFDNGKNYSFSNTNPLEKLTIKNSNVLGDFGSINATTLDVTNNSWQDGISVTTDDFKSIDYSQLLNARKADGSLPDVTFFNLNAGSDLIDKGIDVGLSFNGSAPDLGAFEF